MRIDAPEKSMTGRGEMMLRRWSAAWCCLQLLMVSVAPVAASAQILSAAEKLRESPEAFAQRIVNYAQGSSNKKLSREIDKANADALDPEFSKLIDDNRKLYGRFGDEDLDHDPVCECQGDSDKLHILGVSHRADGFVDVRVENNVKYTMVLRRSRSGWKIYDIIDEALGSTRAWLTRHNRCARAARRESDLDKCPIN